MTGRKSDKHGMSYRLNSETAEGRLAVHMVVHRWRSANTLVMELHTSFGKIHARIDGGDPGDEDDGSRGTVMQEEAE